MTHHCEMTFTCNAFNLNANYCLNVCIVHPLNDKHHLLKILWTDADIPTQCASMKVALIEALLIRGICSDRSLSTVNALKVNAKCLKDKLLN